MEIPHVEFYDGATRTNLLFTVDCNYYSKKINTQASINFNCSDISCRIQEDDTFYVADSHIDESDKGIYFCAEVNENNQVLLMWSRN